MGSGDGKPRARPVRMLAWALIGGACLSASGYGGYHLIAGGDTMPTTEVMVRADLASVVRATGQIRPLHEVEVGTQASGQLRALRVKLGDRVTRGQLLAEIDPELPENELRDRQAKLQAAVARGQAARTEQAQKQKAWERVRALRRVEASSQEDLERAQAALEVRQAVLREREIEVLSARIGVDRAKARLAQTRIIAPMDGEVVAIAIKEGQTVVAAQTAQVIMTLADMTRMTVETHVSEADITRVAPGQPVSFSVLAEPFRRIDGVLREVEPSPAKPVRDTSRAIYYNALFDVDNATGLLRSRMTADVTIVRQRVSAALSVPLSAVIDLRDGDRGQVRVVEGGRVRTRDVEFGLRNDLRIEVRKGLREGDRVVVVAAADDDQRGVSERRERRA